MVINIVIIKMIKKTLSYHSTPLKLHISFRISDAETLRQNWLSVAGVAWLSFQAKVDGNFLLGVVFATKL
jgi:hypothetical protein